MRRRDNLLFFDGDLHGTLQNQERQITEQVNAIPRDQFLATPEEDLVDHIISELHIEPLQLHEDSMEMEQVETRIDVSQNRDRNPFGDPGPIYVQGVSITVSLPFTGEPALLKMRPNRYQSVFPRADIQEPSGTAAGSLELGYGQPSDEDPSRLKQQLDSDIKSIKFYVDAQREQVEQFNSSAPAKIREAIKARKVRLEKNEGIAQMMGIPLKQRDGAPSTKPIQIERKLVKPLPPPPKSEFKPEPGIADVDYEHILSVIRHEGRTFEATPGTYSVHDEEQLRDIILAHLNGHYQGGATGETFRRSGKTDIRIEDKDRAAFVAECKMWRGQKELRNAVDQLLDYLTWRDCKASIIVFNKNNAKFSELLKKIPETLEAHEKFKRSLGQQGDGEWRYVFSSSEDESREIFVNVFVFNIYVA